MSVGSRVDQDMRRLRLLWEAAPDLLAMCEAVLPLLDGHHDGSQQYEDMRAYQADQIREVIKKAKGQ